MPSATALPPLDEFPFHVELEVRFRHIDAMGHLNNEVYFNYLETARGAFMGEMLGVDPREPIVGHQAMTARYPYILLDNYCRYLAPVSLGQRVWVYTRCAEVGTKSFVLEYLIVDGQSLKPVAHARSTQVWFNYRNQTTEPLPAELVTKLREGNPC